MNVLAQPVVLDGAHTARLRLRRVGAACGLGAMVLTVGGFLTQLATTTTDASRTAYVGFETDDVSIHRTLS
ncbi:MAG: hypothetical protein M3N33_06650 [Actinomycetota bacterium]|nr:hypothetical protein [Actinomycetota bacterium]